MFANAFQSGFISVFYSIGSNPLTLWDKTVKNGHIRRIIDEEVKSLVLEVAGTNVATTYITCPIKPRASLGIKLPFLVMVVKNLKKYFTFEIQIIDDKEIRRRFRVSNFQSTTKVRPFCTTMPIGLSSGWNQIQFNLADFTRRAYGTAYMETVRVQVHANVRIRRIYFSDRLYAEDELPSEYKLFLPVNVKKDKQQPPQKAAKSVDKTAAAAKPDVETKTREAEKEIPSGAPPTPNEPAAVREEAAAAAAVVEEEVKAVTSVAAVAAAGDVADVTEFNEPEVEEAAAPLEEVAAVGEAEAAPPEAEVAEGESAAPAAAEDVPPPAADEPPAETEPPTDDENAEAPAEN